MAWLPRSVGCFSLLAMAAVRLDWDRGIIPTDPAGEFRLLDPLPGSLPQKAKHGLAPFKPCLISSGDGRQTLHRVGLSRAMDVPILHTSSGRAMFPLSSHVKGLRALGLNVECRTCENPVLSMYGWGQVGPGHDFAHG